MNLAITTTSTRTWKAVKRHYLLGFTAALLAVAALGAGSMMSTDAGTKAGQPSPVSSASRSTLRAVPASPTMTYYIVGSEEQRLSVQAQAEGEVEDNALYYPEKQWKFAVLVAGTPEEEADVLATITVAGERWANAGASGLQVLDLRSR